MTARSYSCTTKVREEKHYAYINIYTKTPWDDDVSLYLPLKQMKTEMGKVKTNSIIEPTVANTSMKPPVCPSAENMKKVNL